MNRACTFFGHRDCSNTITSSIKAAVIELVEKQGVNMFYVGDSGNFDACCRVVLKGLGVPYVVVLSRMPSSKRSLCMSFDTLLPEEVEKGPPRFAIERRNRYMIEKSQYVICYLRHRVCSGAAKFVDLAERKGKSILYLSDSI